MGTNQEDDEWEYIYDELGTETITFTIDLSATPAGPNTSNTDSPANNSETPAENDQTPVEPVPAATITPAKSSKPSSVQFLDLAHSRPYISYKGQIFTGSWSQNIGSDLVFAAAVDVPPDFEPIIEDRLGRWALLGISQTTLIAKPIELVKKRRLGLPTATTGDVAPRKPFSILLKGDTDPAVRQQAEFLEQLQAIKIARGEKDIVYFGKNLEYIDAAGKKRKVPKLSKKDEKFLAHGIMKRGREQVVEDDDESDSDEEEVAEEDEGEDTAEDETNDAANGEAVEQEPLPRSTPATFDITAKRKKTRFIENEDEIEIEQTPAKKPRNQSILPARIGGGVVYGAVDGDSAATDQPSDTIATEQAPKD